MSMHYSATLRRPPRGPVSPSQACATILGSHIRSARLRDGRSLKELAPKAGLTVAEWEAIERGQLPIAWEQILLLATVLGLGRSWMPYLSRLWAKAWPK